jgi:transcriptional regulator with XRE-family HTH domain
MSDLEQLGKQLRRRRQGLGATQVEVARLMGVARQWLARVEAGTGNPDLRQLLRLCEVLDAALSVAPRHGLREVAAVASRRPVMAKSPAETTGKARARPQQTVTVKKAVGRTVTTPRAPRRGVVAGRAAGPAAGLTADLDALLSSHTRVDR